MKRLKTQTKKRQTNKSHMYGVTGVIVVVLLLMIAIAMTGMVFVFFTTLTTTTTQEAEKTITSVQKEASTRAIIVSPKSGAIKLQNIGTISFKASEVLLLEDDILKEPNKDGCSSDGIWGNSDDVAVGAITTSSCTCNKNSIITIMFKGRIMDSRNCIL